MYSENVPTVENYDHTFIPMQDLLDIVLSSGRASWTVLSNSPGIYVVFLPKRIKPIFLNTTGKAIYCKPISAAKLEDKWIILNCNNKTDILYIGKGDNLRSRIRSLLRFGVGKADNHKGGEWLWQIKNINETMIKIIQCPKGKQKPFENWLLDTFRLQHGDWPLANREGGKKNVLWHP